MDPGKERKHVYPALGLKAVQWPPFRIEYLMHRNSLDQLLHLISHIDLLPGSPFKLLDLVVALRLGSSKAVRLVRVKSRMYVSLGIIMISAKACQP